MCGIVGYVGVNPAKQELIDSLKKLEYRGYDSVGITILNSSLDTYKSPGKIADLETILPVDIDGYTGIGHTRWATHGQPTKQNAHPHLSGNISIVHNGIIENYQQLKEELIEAGYEFRSETDTEVIAHLLNSYYQQNDDFHTAFQNTLKRLDGSYAVAAVCDDMPDIIITGKKNSPLVVGLGNGCNFAASDITAFLKHTKDVVFLEDLEIAQVQQNEVQFFDLEGNPIQKKKQRVEWDLEDAEKAGYEHFMLKEIHEQTKSVYNTFAGKLSELDGSINLEELNLTKKQIRNLTRIELIACGTSYNAGLIAKYLFEQLAGIHTNIDTGSEYRYRYPVFCDSDDVLSIAISQSGETADTIAALQSLKSSGCRTLAITNVMGSSITRDADDVMYIKAGPELGVAATKTFTSQLTILYLLAVHFARIRRNIDIEESRNFIKALKKLPGNIQRILNAKDTVRKYAKQFSEVSDYFFIGRYMNYPVALEGALKLKEISYIHAEGYAAGELKHGPLALITEDTPVVAIATSGHTYDKIISNIMEVKARNATVIAVAEEDDNEIEKYVDLVLRIPKTDELLSPILSNIVLQLLAYYTALAKGCSIDKPRNLAKSVTVE
ncbi:glucosamine/fructose-6-phosphate aminotransferase, isomerizing (plasmid) [Methanohalobium evestigatum Z-7303]|uniref:Glutamine--fructose-6-phosphate aminotransferase [isomerizing] n=1 Tax=Methanohalobium evestigatum (strain ATCC BAA-1072 / DSM 3721 / NBRC 107634 / OCM 161 / Z-7303) TaxID=644295 RepID=D7EBX2_METEZ|nr:glutamine--fructose-6-phosphate transaminase (isomerizing) [Methanohalobium evestigatum]ADI75094.1 glucosamine/fructose-6-phosphate aminotransferase, isomerizing [Methanohalobium evestigatum Z-7303]